MAISDYAHYPLWLLTRTMTRVLRDQFGVDGVDPNEEFVRAKAAGVTKDAYMEQMFRRAWSSPFGREAREKYQTLGVPESELKFWIKTGLERDFEDLAQSGKRGPEDVHYSEWIRWAANDRVRGAWNEQIGKIEKRIRERFGMDARFPSGVRSSPSWDNPVDSQTVAREFETTSRELSVKASWQHRVLDRMAKRRKEGAGYSEGDLQKEVKWVEQQNGSDLEAMDLDRHLEELDQKYPAPATEPIPVSRQLAAPLSPVEDLAFHLARAARNGPVDLWIWTGSDGRLVGVHWESVEDVSYRQSLLSEQELNRLDEALKNWGYRRKLARYRMEIPAGTRAETIGSFLRLAQWWESMPDSSKPWIVKVSWPMALPDPTKLLSSGLEDERNASQGLPSSV